MSYQINYCQPNSLERVAFCQKACFPESFSSKLGLKYLRKSLSWFLNQPNRFLYYIEVDGVVVGFCGGFVPQFYGDGSSSGMLQFAFKEAVLAVMLKPWLLFHSELRKFYPFIYRNIKKKIGLSKTTAVINKPNDYVFKHYCGLVVIGVHPSFRGKGIFEVLMKEFDTKAKELLVEESVLTVRKDNERAIAAYRKMGWTISSIEEQTLQMKKKLF